MASVTLLTGGSVPKGLESHTKERKGIRIIDIARKENSMTDKEKRELKDGVVSIFKRFNILDHTSTIGNLRDDILRYIESLQEEHIILTEEILKKNGFRLNPRPLYKYPYWSKLFTASDERCYCFMIYMEQQIRETLMTVMPLASNEPSQPTCYLPHPKYVQQLQDSLNLFGIKNNIEV